MRILITAGATWVKVDEVRILTNIFTGKTGLYLAKALKKRGHTITLLANPHCLGEIKGFKVIPFRYFDEFKVEVNSQLRAGRYDAIIHTAAVSDYKLTKDHKGKIPSGKKKLTLKLKPAEKIIKIIRHKAKKAIVVQFKLEAKAKGLKNKAFLSLKANGTDLVVANAYEDLKKGYKAYIIDRQKKAVLVCSLGGLADKLDKAIKELL